MKKIFLFTLMLLAASSLYAQNVQFGLRAGPSFTTLGGEDAKNDDLKIRIGFHAGGYASFTLSESLSFDAELQYANKGAKATDGSSSSVLRNGYLDLPLLLKIHTGDMFYLLAGAQPSLMISSAVILDNNGNKVTVNGSEVRELWKDADLAGVIGIGVDLGAGINVQTTYEHGFINISEISGEIYNRGLKLSIGKTF